MLAYVLCAGTAAGGDDEARCLALTMYWEARDEGRPGMVAVAGSSLTGAGAPVPLRDLPGGEEARNAPCQFSFWCDGRMDEPDEAESWALARTLARELLAAPPRGALPYHRADVRPGWSRQYRATARIGRHIYYR